MSLTKEQLRARFKRLLENIEENTSQEGLMLQGMALMLDRVESQGMYADVVAFHEKFGIDYKGGVRFLDKGLQKFRDARLREELAEYQHACDAANPEGMLDALVDLVYIALGTAHIHGFHKFDEAWRRVHAANMQKVNMSVENPSKHGHVTDIVKPKGWVAPDLSDLV